MDIFILDLTIEPGSSVRYLHLVSTEITDIFFLHVARESCVTAKVLLAEVSNSGILSETIVLGELCSGTRERINIRERIVEKNKLVEFSVQGNSAVRVLGKASRDDTLYSVESDNLHQCSTVPTLKNKCESDLPNEAAALMSGPIKPRLKGKEKELIIAPPAISINEDFTMLEMMQAWSSHQVASVDLFKGQGLEVKHDSVVSVRLRGTLMDRSRFATAIRNEIKITMGSQVTTQGLQAGMLGMREGGRRIMLVPPEYGYGRQNRQNIPPESTLLYDCIVREVHTGD